MNYRPWDQGINGIEEGVRNITRGQFHIRFSYDISKRTAKCALCQLPIPPKTKRVGFSSIRLTPRRKDGRRIPAGKAKYYAHFYCWVQPEEEHPCVDCNAPIPDYVGRSICFWCQMSPKYRICEWCGTIVRTPDVRRVAMGETQTKIRLCKGCRAGFADEIRYAQIVKRLEETGELWDDTKKGSKPRYPPAPSVDVADPHP